MQWLQILFMIIAIGFFIWSVVSLVRAILVKRKAKREVKNDDRKEEETIK